MAPTPPSGICGPDVTNQFSTVLRKIQSDFRSWSREDREKACRRILLPVKMPTAQLGTNLRDYMHSAADLNGWDILPLYQGTSAWLRDPGLLARSCAIPSSSNPAADPFDDVHEDENTCSNTVQVGGQCWLNGTVNYGAFGIMARLCKDEFSVQFAFAQRWAEGLIKLYKSIGPHSEDSTLPIAWFQATFFGGPRAIPTNPGNRSQCKTTCPLDGSIVNWDYVWEPIKPRVTAIPPVLTLPPSPAPSPPPPGPAPAAKSHTVVHGDTLSNIAQKYYGNSALWTKIYAANKAVIGSNPNLLKPGQKLIIL
jgi:LysM domain